MVRIGPPLLPQNVRTGLLSSKIMRTLGRPRPSTYQTQVEGGGGGETVILMAYGEMSRVEGSGIWTSGVAVVFAQRCQVSWILMSKAECRECN